MSRRTIAQWRDLIAQQQSSGVSAAQFCRERSINSKYFSTRKKQLCGSAKSFVQIAPRITSSTINTSVQLRVIEAEVPSEALLETLSLLFGQRER